MHAARDAGGHIETTILELYDNAPADEIIRALAVHDDMRRRVLEQKPLVITVEPSDKGEAHDQNQ